MAKITDYTEITTEIETQLNQGEWSLLDFVGMETAKLIIANIYMSNDIMKGYGQDIGDTLSIISSPRNISVIHDGVCGRFKSDDSLCIYESLTDDVSQILMIMQAAFDRVQY